MASPAARRIRFRGDPCVSLGAPLCAVLSVSCVAVPPVNPGYVTTQRSRPGRVLAGAQGGLGVTAPGTENVAGTMHLEPFVTEDSSLPVDASVQRPIGDEYGGNTRVMARLGYRTRVSQDRFVVGFGAGPSYLTYESADDGGERHDQIEAGLSGFGFELGGELAYELRSRYLGLSFAGRPCLTWNQAAQAALWVVPELSGAVFITEHLGVTLSGLAGVAAVFVTDRQDLGNWSHDGDGVGLTFTGQALTGLVWTEAPQQDSLDRLLDDAGSRPDE